MMRPQTLAISSLLFLGALTALPAQRLVPGPEHPTRDLGVALRQIGSEGRALYVTAHPDDEDNRLLAWLGLGRGIDSTLLTMTRGEGGQNAIGNELFEALGVLRMQELATAHRYDGAAQRFGRVFEFGYSFSVAETFQKWGEEATLREVVAAMRAVRPQVVFTMPREATRGGQHHQASARLAEQAFEIAASPRWPELGPPWAVQRLFEQVWGEAPKDKFVVTPPVDTYDPLLGTTYRDLGFRARSSHKCQETGQILDASPGLRARHFALVAHRGAGPTDPVDPFGGLPIFRDPQSGELGTDDRRADVFAGGKLPDPTDPAACRAAILSALGNAPATFGGDLRRALGYAIPVLVEARLATDVLLGGSQHKVRLILHNRSAANLAVAAVQLRTSFGAPRTVWEGNLDAGARREESFELVIPLNAPATTVRLDRGWDAPDRYEEVDLSLPNTSLGSVALRAEFGAQPLQLAAAPLISRTTDRLFPRVVERDAVVLPSIEARFAKAVFVHPGSTEGPPTQTLRVPVEVRFRSAGVSRDGDLPDYGQLVLEGRWHGQSKFSALTALKLDGRSGKSELAFDLARLPARTSEAARWEVELRLRHQVDQELRAIGWSQAVDYPHIRRAFLGRPARSRLVGFPCILPDREQAIGYIAGTGDALLDEMRAVGLKVVAIEAVDLATGDLEQFRTILVGVRAYRVREDLRAAHERLMQWMQDGGHLIVQYNKDTEMNSGRAGRGGSPFVPFTARASRNRITVEESPVQTLLPQHAFLQGPNRIGAADWQGWVQERSTYHLETKDDRYEHLLGLADPWPLNEGLKRGSLVSAPVGEGRWTYVGLTLFRQIPAGVSGAWRLLGNLLHANP